MKPGDVVLIRLPQVAGGPPKLRPALVLAMLPGPFQNVLICGISTQLKDLQPEWDELINKEDADFLPRVCIAFQPSDSVIFIQPKAAKSPA